MCSAPSLLPRISGLPASGCASGPGPGPAALDIQIAAMAKSAYYKLGLVCQLRPYLGKKDLAMFNYALSIFELNYVRTKKKDRSCVNCENQDRSGSSFQVEALKLIVLVLQTGHSFLKRKHFTAAFWPQAAAISTASFPRQAKPGCSTNHSQFGRPKLGF